MSEIRTGTKDEDETWKENQVRFPGVGKLNRMVDNVIAHNSAKKDDSIERYRQAVASDAASLICSDIFPEQIDAGDDK